MRAGLSEREANQIVVALDRAAIAASKVEEPGGEKNRYEVEVGAAEVTRALQILEAEQLPKPTPAGFEQLYPVTGLVATPEEERARWVAASAGELSRSLERLEGVLDARVHLALPEVPRSLDAEQSLPKASALIRRRHDAAPVDESMVRALIAGAVDGLSSERVTVVQVVGYPTPVTRPSFASFGPISVARESVAALKTVLGVALGLDLVMAVALVALAYTRRRSTDS